MIVDVRKDNVVDRIVFGYNEYIVQTGNVIELHDDESYHSIYIEDIPNLIKALEIAYKEWHTDD